MTRATYRVVMIPCKSGLYEIKGGYLEIQNRS